MTNITYKPTVFWGWNSFITKDEIKRDLKSFSEQGIGGVFVHARAGLNIEYLGEKWFDAFELTINECKKYNIEVWIYDEQGWPSGFAGGLVSNLGEPYSLKYLSMTSNFDEVDLSRYIASYKKNGQKFEQCKMDYADYHIFYKVEPHYVDLLNPLVTSAFIKSTHEKYKERFASEFGKTIKGVFTDEPQIHISALAWSDALPKAFYNQNGYDIRECLPYLFEEFANKKYRYQYYEVVRSLFVKNYTKKIAEWCDENNLIFTGHFAGEEGLCVQTGSNTGVMPHYEYMSMPGIDSLGRSIRSVVLMKQIESVASQFDKKRNLSEVFATTGNGISFYDLKRIWGYHLIFDVNLSCMSISMMSLEGIRKRDYPVFISKQQPWWNYFNHYSEWVEKAGKLTNNGVYDANVLLISSINSALYENIFSLDQKIVSSNFRKINEMLTNSQIQYSIGDEILLEKYGRVENSLLKLKNGSYNTVILPEQTGIASSTLKLLKEFHRNGGMIVQIQRYPTHIDGIENPLANEILSKISTVVIQERQDILEKCIVNCKIDRKFRVVDDYGKTVYGLIVKTKKVNDDYVIIVFNQSQQDIKGQMKTNLVGYFNEEDILSGNKKNITKYNSSKNTLGSIEIKKGELKVFNFSKEKYEDLVNNNKVIEEITLPFKQFTNDNTLVIDKAVFEIGDYKIDKATLVTDILKKLFDIVESQNETLLTKVTYDFNVNYKTDLHLSLEMQGSQEVLVNGIKVWDISEPVPNDKFIDDSLVKFDISDKIKRGLNKVEVTYLVTPSNLGYKIDEVHHAVKNKFSYPFSIENIYISGNFDIESKDEVVIDEKAVSVKGPFTIVEPSNKVVGDVISQNKFFYCGNLIYEGTIDYDQGNYKIKPNFEGTGSMIFINDKEVGLSDGLNGLDVTPYLVKGTNKVTIEVLGSLRNMYGPHHHVSKEPEFTGVNSFTGDYGGGAVEDISNQGETKNILTEEYHVIRQGLNFIKIIKD